MTRTRSRASRLAGWALAALLGAGGPMAADSARAAEPRSDLERDRRLVDTYRQMLAEEPGQEYAFRRLLETAHAVGGLVGLIELYRVDVDRNPKDYAGWLVLGSLQRTADNGEAALECFAKAAALKPERAEPHLLTAAWHRQRRAYVEAFAAYDRAIGLLRERAAKQEALRAAAEAAVEGKALDRAREYFGKLIQTEPGNVFLRMQEASTLTRLDEPALALEKWKEVEDRAGGQLQHLVIAWKEMAELEAQLGRFEAAEATWRKGLDRLPQGHYERRTFLEGLVSIHRRQDELRRLVPELAALAERDLEALVTLARVHEELAEDELALARYREAQKRRPHDEEVRMAALRIIERIGRPEEVLAAWIELVKAFPNEPRHELKLGELYFQHDKAPEAQALLRRISRAHPQDPGVHVQLVDLWMRYGDKASKAEVEGEYKILLRLEPNEPSHVMSLGEYYWTIDDRARALQTWARLLKMGNGKGEGHYLLGETLADHELYPEALTELGLALAAEPDNERYVRALALLLEKTGKPKDALGAWQNLLERQTAARGRTTAVTREAREHIIQLWDKAERLDIEVEALSRRFGAEPPDLAAGRFLSVALQRVGRTSEARAVLERMDALEPDDLETLTGLEQVYSRQGEDKLAMAILERLAKLVPRAAVDYLHRAADLALGAGDEAAAKKIAKQIIELAPADPIAHQRVGELYQRMGFRAEAAEAWRQALVLDPRSFPVRFKLASLYRDLGNAAREEQVLSSIVREASDSADVLRAGRRLLQLALATGRLAEVEALLRPLVESGRGDATGRASQLKLVIDVYGHLAQAIRFGSGTDEQRERQLAELGERALRPLLEALEDADVSIRARALEVLELSHPPGATPALARLAQEPESMSQVEAISALGRTGSAGATLALTRLAGSTVAATRELALWALGLSGTAEAGAALTEKARRGAPRDRLLAAAALGHGRHPGTSAMALELARDRSSDVREVGLWAVGRLGAVDALGELGGRLERSQSAREGQIAAWGLQQLGTDAARQALVAALWNGNPNTPALAIWSALSVPPEAGAAAMEAQVRATYGALVARDRGLVSPVRPSLYVPELTRIGPVAELLAEGGALSGPVAARVAELMAGRRPEPMRALAATLLGGPRLSLVPQASAGQDLLEGLTLALLNRHKGAILTMLAEDDELREVWLPVMGRWLAVSPSGPLALTEGDRQAVETAAFEVLAATRAPSSRRSGAEGALEVLAGLGATASGLTPQQQALVLDHLGARTPTTRLALARVLALMRHEEGLARLLADSAPLVRIAAARAIAAERVVLGAAALAELVDLARDPLPEVAVEAVRALAVQGKPALLDALEPGAPPHVWRALEELRRPR